MTWKHPVMVYIATSKPLLPEQAPSVMWENNMDFHEEIAGFFATYVDAFARNDADALSGLWDEVGLFPSPTGNFAISSRRFAITVSR